ncbi:unnamed protein product, partial [Brenthis ino]
MLCAADAAPVEMSESVRRPRPRPRPPAHHAVPSSSLHALHALLHHSLCLIFRCITNTSRYLLQHDPLLKYCFAITRKMANMFTDASNNSQRYKYVDALLEMFTFRVRRGLVEALGDAPQAPAQQPAVI